jgi:FkbM family methyltransferase
VTSPNDPARSLCNDLERRIALTVAADLTASITKVDDAGLFTEVDGTPVQVMHNGVVVLRDGYLGPWQSQVINELRGHHEPQEEVVFDAILKRLAKKKKGGGRAMLELGAWWSYYSLWFKQAFPEAAVIGIEPDEPFLATGRRNFELNEMEGTLLHGVVGPNPGEMLRFQAASDGQFHEVRQYGLGELLALAGVDQFDVILADIQGAETTFLATSAELLRSGACRFLLVSTHDPLISGSAMTHRDVVAAITALGGHIIAEHSVSESFSGDGLVAASFHRKDRKFTVDIPHARAVDSLFGEWEPRLATVIAERDELQSQVNELATELQNRIADHERTVQHLEAVLAAERAILHRIRSTKTWRITSRFRKPHLR